MRSPSAARQKTLKKLVAIAATLLVVSAGTDVPLGEAAKLETEATWLEVCRIDSPLERLAAARTLKPIKGHSGASSGCAERF
jgi:hypothetical protein